MDSKYGGIPSPILTSKNSINKFLPFPIPFPEENSNVKYSDLIFFEEFSALDFIKSLAGEAFGVRKKVSCYESLYCHLDPDLRKSILKRKGKWVPAFGQVNQAQSHLGKYVQVGDIFLFFGWFQFAELNGKSLRYKPTVFPNGFHALYGYLQIGEIIDLSTQTPPEYLLEHPHVKHKINKPFNSKNNTIYIANEYLKEGNSFTQIPGSGYFNFSDDLILTKKGQVNKATWQLPIYFHPKYKNIDLTYNKLNKNKDNWTISDTYSFLDSARIGQEFVFQKDSNNEVNKWALNLIKSYHENL